MADVAPIYSAAEDARRAESAVWEQFSAAKDTSEFCASWLAILCMQIDRATGALLLLGPDKEGAYSPAAVWPDAGREMKYLSPVAQRALTERRGIVADANGKSPPAPDKHAFISYPIEVSGVLHGVVVLDLTPGPERTLQQAMRLVHWASAWLIDQFRQRALREQEARLARMALAMDIVATSVQERRFAPSALAVANDLANRLHCDRVSIGRERSGSVAVVAISHTATFNPRMELARHIGEAMDEVLDLDCALVLPPRDEVEMSATAHADLARRFGDSAICSVPLLENGHASGVLLFERNSGQAFDPETIELCKTVGALLGPILSLKRENERNLLQHAGESLRTSAQALVGPRHPGAKLLALVAIGILVFCSIATGTYRVSARTVVEGAVQRTIAAPFDGFIRESFVRAGDTIRAGQPICRLDDKDLKLEQSRLLSEREQLLRKQRQALAAQERASLAVLAAQIDQANAALAFVGEKLARATLVAPFAGLVVSGDLSQLLGTPVELGQVLFEIAPLDAYRVIVEVDERDIAWIEVGQRGELTLSGIPDQNMEFLVERITPVSTAKEGRNYFRVEARVLTQTDNLRPGMQGVGKIVVGEEKLIWIWTHSLVSWLRLTAWNWLP